MTELQTINNMSDNEIIEYVSKYSDNSDIKPKIIKYIIDRGEGSIEGKEENEDLYELFDNERHAYDGIRFGKEFCPDFVNYIITNMD